MATLSHLDEKEVIIPLGYSEPLQITKAEWDEREKWFVERKLDIYTTRMGPPPYGSDEVENRTANEIKQLPRYTAKIRMNTGEYRIETIEPKDYIPLKELKDRIAKIQQQNIRDGYLRLRSEVEAEIQARQNPPPPAAPQPAKPTPKTPIAPAPAKASVNPTKQPADASQQKTEPLSDPSAPPPSIPPRQPTPRRRKIKP